VSDLRLYIVFRADLPEMTRGKGEVQAAHAAASIVRYCQLHEEGARLDDWFGPETLGQTAQRKVLLEGENKAALDKMVHRAATKGVPFMWIRDAAHTVFTTPTITCVAFGPCTKTEGNAITRGARMRT
jgi:peptidyl-tRNA hydrolase